MTLADSLTEWQALADKLRTMYPDLAEDDPALVDTIDGETNLTQKLAILIRSAEDDRVLAAALSIRIAEMDERRKRIEARMERKRELAASAMEQCHIKRIDAPEFTVSLSNGRPSVIITSEGELPSHVLIPQPPKADKKAIIGLLKAGVAVPGAMLSNAPPHISVRRS